MYLPINGRIAIIDNEIAEVMPLLKTFSKNRIPYLYIDGSNAEWLPAEDSQQENDIRLLFLDLNLTGDRTPTTKEVESMMYSLLKRVISPNNFPYSIILWSKQENEYAKVVKDLFDGALKDRKPISIKSFIKSNFFNLDGSEKAVPTNDLLIEIKNLIKQNQAYSTLIYWENKVHKSADSVLHDVFTAYNDKTWTDTTNFVISKLGQAYLGYKKFNSSSYVDQTKGSLHAFNNIFNDTLEYAINSCTNLEEQEKLVFDETSFTPAVLLDTINDRLLLSKSNLDLDNIDYTGTVSEDKNPKSNTVFEGIFNESFDRFSVVNEIPNYKNLDLSNASAAVNKLASAKRKEIRKSWQKIYAVLTPLCDKVQGKQRNIRVVKGFIINKEYKHYIDDKSEAIYISPSFYDSQVESSRIIVLNFRYFFTFNGNVTKLKNIESIFRLRQTVVSEIQSKLSRHVSRQGILYIE